MENLLILISGGKDSTAASIEIEKKYPNANKVYVSYKAENAIQGTWPIGIESILIPFYNGKDFTIIDGSGTNFWQALHDFILGRGEQPSDYYVVTGECDFFRDYVDTYAGMSRAGFKGIFNPLFPNGKQKLFDIHESNNSEFIITSVLNIFYSDEEIINLNNNIIGQVFNTKQLKNIYDLDASKFYSLQSLVIKSDAHGQVPQTVIDEFISNINISKLTNNFIFNK